MLHEDKILQMIERMQNIENERIVGNMKSSSYYQAAASEINGHWFKHHLCEFLKRENNEYYDTLVRRVIKHYFRTRVEDSINDIQKFVKGKPTEGEFVIAKRLSRMKAHNKNLFIAENSDVFEYLCNKYPSKFIEIKDMYAKSLSAELKLRVLRLIEFDERIDDEMKQGFASTKGLINTVLKTCDEIIDVFLPSFERRCEENQLYVSLDGVSYETLFEISYAAVEEIRQKLNAKYLDMLKNKET